MYQEQPAVFEAEERISTDQRIAYIDPTAAIMRGRALQGIYLRKAFGALFAAIGASVGRGVRAYRARVALTKLDDRMLADIGISRAEAAAIVAGRSYHDETRKPRSATSAAAPVTPAGLQPAH